MKRLRTLWGLALTLLLAACAPRPRVLPSPTLTPTAPTYQTDIKPILDERCIRCHSGENPPHGLRLDSYEHILAGSTYRAEIIPGDPDASEMVRRIRGEAVPRMPFDGPPFLNEEQIRLIEARIAGGVPER
ncbi:MAG: hypothetical protein Fur0043_07360 [Anaerolineales bacterium]